MALRSQVIGVGSSYRLRYASVADADGAPVDDASVEARVQTLQGVDVDGQTWPLELTLTGSGQYDGVLSEGLELTPGSAYLAVVTATRGTDVAVQRLLLIAARRSG